MSRVADHPGARLTRSAAGHIKGNVTRTVHRYVIVDEITRALAAMDEIVGQADRS
jgi:hypothetical protein